MYYIPYLLDVSVYLNTFISDVLFTGKLVKSLLIDANPQLKEVFAKVRGVEPKLMHITPLYTVSNGKTKCLYSYASINMKDGAVKKHRIALKNGMYKFYIGFIEKQFRNVKKGLGNAVNFDLIYNTLLNIGGTHVFGKYSVKVDLASINVVDIHTYTNNIVREFLKYEGKLKIIFSSPTLLRDPLRTSKHKSLVPTVLNIFSTPVYITSYLRGEHKRKIVMSTLILLHRLLNEPYSVLNTVSIKWVVYDRTKQPIPALTGYVNLHLNKAYYEVYNRKYNLEELLREILTVMSALGTGTSRATGFGHITIQSSRIS